MKGTKPQQTKSQNTTLTLERHGSFAIRTTGPNHCGTEPFLTLSYSLVALCEANLDERGFLFDQVKVDEFFKTIKTTDLSCEKLTIWAAREVFKLIMNENPQCVIKELTLTLSPSPFVAKMTFNWKAEQKNVILPA